MASLLSACLLCVGYNSNFYLSYNIRISIMAKDIEKEFFVDQTSVVRRIWGKGDTILFIFAGASAEFALNKAVDWLYFTGRLPADPLGRLFSTVSYARAIIFSDKCEAHKAIEAIVTIHTAIEDKRGAYIPDWAYRDVLFMLIDYSIRSYELLEKDLTLPEKEEVFNVFKNVGIRMGINGLPEDYREWKILRQVHMEKDLLYSYYTVDLFFQYRKHLGLFRYHILREAQRLVIPPAVRTMMKMRGYTILRLPIKIYKIIRYLNFDKVIKSFILPYKFKKDILALDNVSS